MSQQRSLAPVTGAWGGLLLDRPWALSGSRLAGIPGRPLDLPLQLSLVHSARPAPSEAEPTLSRLL